MSTSVKQVSSATAAAKQIAQELGLDDAKRLANAITLAAAEELAYNALFGARIRAAYNRLPATPTRPKVTTPKAPKVTLTPIKRVEGFEFNPGAPLNPYLVYEAFGAHQLHAALDLFSLAKLQDAARRVMERAPGTKPSNMRAKAAIIEYIERHVAR